MRLPGSFGALFALLIGFVKREAAREDAELPTGNGFG
jgi:hypothetical protein